MREEVIFVGVMITVFVSGLFVGIYFQDPGVKIGKEREIEQKKSKELEDYKVYSKAGTKLVAVDQKGNGVLTNLNVRAVPGDGRVLVDVKSLLFWIDTQQSIQKAREVAEEYLGKESKNLDLTYAIDIPNASVVGGPSAGAAFTLATIAALQNKTLDKDVVITGAVNEDGTIGKVGGIIGKARAVKEGGYNTFLIPEGQKEFTEYGKEEECHEYGSMRICDIDYKKIEVNVEEEVGIDVEEVSNIEEAANYFLT